MARHRTLPGRNTGAAEVFAEQNSQNEWPAWRFTMYERPGGGRELRTERYLSALEQGFRALRGRNHSDMQRWLEEVGAVA